MSEPRSHNSWPTSLGERVVVRKRRRVRGLATLAAALPLLIVSAGCTANGLVDNTNNAVILVINSIVPTSDPFGDVITTSGTILDDIVLVSFSAHLKAPVTTTPTVVAPELQEIILDRYEVVYERTDGGTSVPPGFVRGMTARVRITERGSDELVFTEISLVVLPSTTKAQPPISFLISPGSEPDTNFTNIQINAKMSFFGRTLAGDEVAIVGNIGMNLANFGDTNS